MMWAPPTTGTEPTEYYVQLRDNFAQIILEEVVEDTFILFSYKGVVRGRVFACDIDGQCGPWSPWSAFWLSPSEGRFWYQVAADIGYPPLQIITVLTQSYAECWEEHYEGDAD